MILSRLLTPRDFGVVALAKVAVGVANTLQADGFGQAIVQREDLKPHHVTTGLWTSLGVGTLIAALVGALAGPAAYFMDEPALRPVLQTLAFVFVISAAGTVPTAMLQRSLSFRKTLIADLVGLASFSALAITLGFCRWGLWSLVWAMVLQETVRVCLLWPLSGVRARVEFSPIALRQLSAFGLPMAAGALLRHGSIQIANLITGKCLGAAAVGLYNRAYMLATFPTWSVGRALDPVAFSTFSRLQSQPKLAAEAYLRVMAALAGVFLPLIFLLGVLADQAIPLLYGSQWMGVVTPLRVLCVGAVLRLLIGPADVLMRAHGRVDAVLWAQFAQIVGVALGAVVGAGRGTVGVATGVTLAQVPFCGIYMAWTWKVLSIGPRGYWRALRSSLISGGLSALVCTATRCATLPYLPAWGVVLVAGAAGVGAYLLAQLGLPFAETRRAIGDFARNVLYQQAKEASPVGY